MNTFYVQFIFSFCQEIVCSYILFSFFFFFYTYDSSNICSYLGQFWAQAQKKNSPWKKILIFQWNFRACLTPTLPPPKKKKLIKLPCSFRRNWILEQPLLFSGYSSIRFFKVIFCDFRDSHHSHLIFCDFWDTMLEVFTFIPYNLYDLKGTMPHQRSPTTPFRTQRIPRKAENIPSGGMYPNDVHPPTFLAYLQPV